MSAIGPGDWVECVDDSPPRCVNDFGPDLKVGVVVLHRMYCVDEIDEPTEEVPELGLWFADEDSVRIDGDGYDRSWAADRFRPIYRPRADLIESLLQPLSEHVLEQA